MSIDLSWFEEQVKVYSSRLGDHKDFAKTLESVLKSAAGALGVSAIVQARPKAEIQLRTVVQHAWADIGHDRIYKSNFEVAEVVLTFVEANLVE